MVRPVIRVPFQEGTNGAGPKGCPPGLPAFEMKNPTTITAPNATTCDRRKLANGPMSKVPSLMFDMEDADEAANAGGAAHPDLPPEGDVVQQLRLLGEPWDESEYMLGLHVRIAAEEAAKNGAQHVAVTELAEMLRKLGYAVKIRTALGGGWGGACLRNLRHSFLAVTLPPTGPGEDSTTILVDPRFRDQFEIAHATPRYARVLATVPAEAVLPPDRVSQLVEILCAEIAAAFAETGTPLPPWRQTAAMLSKWQPRRSEEVDVARDAGKKSMNSHYNNAAGELPAGMATGHATIAQKLVALGVAPQAPPSPVSEGLEELESWSSGCEDSADIQDVALTVLDGTSSNDDEMCFSMLPLPGQNVITSNDNNGVAAAAAAARGGMSTGAALAAAAVNATSSSRGRVADVWRGIQAAVAATPLRRSTWG
jgi:uncharacterized protein (TIGR01615 family)